ncbi:MAG: hypothetical protein PHI85_10500 [Victivallaceae bacterium]|nr:hypothetical protein [Victivallaceae bacterium]
MEPHINGWNVIARELICRKETQRSLASHLGITPSAVTQAKKCRLMFSLVQLLRICDFLRLGEKKTGELFGEALSSRLKRSLENYADGNAGLPRRIAFSVRFSLQKND